MPAVTRLRLRGVRGARQTRARYVFCVPWMYLGLQDRENAQRVTQKKVSQRRNPDGRIMLSLADEFSRRRLAGHHPGRFEAGERVRHRRTTTITDTQHEDGSSRGPVDRRWCEYSRADVAEDVEKRDERA